MVENVEALQYELYCMKVILNTVSEGVMLADTDGRIVLYNHQMADFEGTQVLDAVGKKITELYGISQMKSEHHIVKDSKTPIVDRYQRYQSNSGKQVNTVASTYPILKDGQVVATFSVASNADLVKKMINRNKIQESIFSELEKKTDNYTRFTLNDLITKNENMIKAIEQSKKISKHGGNVLIYGETGVGKELMAQGIHNAHPTRKNQPFIAINCSAIPDTLLESLLFGTVKGAFTDAENRPGLIEEACEGTLFLDEINSMSLTLQGKLLRVLQEKEFRAVGGNRILKMRCRIISSTNVDTEKCIASGVLREDLFYRLAVHIINIPALRNRQEDILLLAQYFARSYGLKYGLSQISFDEDVLSALSVYHYPGNIRELENLIESAVTLADATQKITLQELPDKLKGKELLLRNRYCNLRTHLLESERSKLLEVLEKEDWNISQAAVRLGIARQNLQYRLKKLHIEKRKSHSHW